MRLFGCAALLFVSALTFDVAAQETAPASEARLAQARAGLSADTGRSRTEMFAALRDARRAGSMDAEVHVAAVEFGEWLLQRRDYRDARRAWEIAVATADAAEAPAYARGRARTGEGVAIFLMELERTMDAPMPRVIADAHDALDEALIALKPAADQPAQSERWSDAQLTFAEAIAWHAALVTTMNAYSGSIPGGMRGAHAMTYEVGAGDNTRPICTRRIAETPSIIYPRRAGSARQVGAVVVGLQTDDLGEIVRYEVVAAVGGADFVGATATSRGQWRIDWETSAPNCRRSATWFTSILFSFEPP